MLTGLKGFSLTCNVNVYFTEQNLMHRRDSTEFDFESECLKVKQRIELKKLMRKMGLFV